jgi:hypothetical protein
LFAALDVATGKVIGHCQKRHRQQEFVRFLEQIERTIPASLDIHLVLAALNLPRYACAGL